jgi:hypothetical protein
VVRARPDGSLTTVLDKGAVIPNRGSAVFVRVTTTPSADWVVSVPAGSPRKLDWRPVGAVTRRLWRWAAS